MAIAITDRTAKYIALLSQDQKTKLMFLITRYFMESVSGADFAMMVSADNAVHICFTMIMDDTHEAFGAEKER